MSQYFTSEYEVNRTNQYFKPDYDKLCYGKLDPQERWGIFNTLLGEGYVDTEFNDDIISLYLHEKLYGEEKDKVFRYIVRHPHLSQRFLKSGRPIGEKRKQILNTISKDACYSYYAMREPGVVNQEEREFLFQSILNDYCTSKKNYNEELEDFYSYQHFTNDEIIQLLNKLVKEEKYEYLNRIEHQLNYTMFKIPENIKELIASIKVMAKFLNQNIEY